jgi:hypothetical protein
MTRNDSGAWSGTVDVGYCLIRVAVDGQRGASHLMLSNSLGNNLTMRTTTGGFAKHFRVIRYDCRGRGKSVASHGGRDGIVTQ